MGLRTELLGKIRPHAHLLDLRGLGFQPIEVRFFLFQN